MNRAQFLRALTTIGFASVSPLALAQQFPSRPIRILIGFGAGGATDAVARLYAQKLHEEMGVPVMIENRPGASQLLAIRPLLSAPADGYTLALLASSALAMGPGVRKDLPYDPLKDFTPVAFVGTSPGVFAVHPDLPVRTIAELIAYAKAHPGKLSYGSAGHGASNHLQTEYFMSLTGTKMVHIAYKSDQEVMREVAAGTIHVGLTTAQAAVPLLGAGKLRAIGVTGSKRLAALPEVPSLTETSIAALRNIDHYSYFGLVGPAGLPAPVVQRISEVMNKISHMPDVGERMRGTLFYEPQTSSPESMRTYIEKDVAKWREVGRSIQLD